MTTQGTEAGTGETACGVDPKGDGPVAATSGDAPNYSLTPPTPTEAEIARIVGSLTEAQMEAVLAAIGDEQIRVIPFRFHRSTGALHRRGLIGLNMTPGVLTPLGLAVRSAIEDSRERD
jgi:hypothetical protein